jgi:hypoxia up-regulated 1
MFSLLINAFLIFVTLFPTHSLASVLAIDYGTDYIKASLVTPGVPFDILLNKDSKRKIQSSVAWKGNNRFFGTDAFNLVSQFHLSISTFFFLTFVEQASRYPEDSYSSLKYILAAPYQSPAHAHFSTISTASTTSIPGRHSIALRRSDPALPPWSVEELIAMQLSYVKDLADSLSSEKVVDAILTVPSYFSQYQRDAIVDAIEIAGMRTLALINDGTAVAVNYAMTRSFPEDQQEYHIIYDAGASSIRATLVGFSTTKSSSSSPHTAVNVLGVGYDREAGGTELDRRLREILLDAFAAKHKRDLRGEKRAMAKLWKESGRVKAVLSANTDTVISVCGLV